MTADVAAAGRRGQRRSPLHHLADLLEGTGSEETVKLTELPFRTQVELRADPGSAVIRRLEQALGVPVPATRAGEVTGPGGGQRWVLWLGPDWWLVVDAPDLAGGLEPALVTTLRDAAGGDASVVDVSAHRTTLELTGRYARTVLEHGCSLDLHPRAFGVGTCAQATLAKAQVVLHHTGESTYRVSVRASYADYLARWLVDATTEYAAGDR